MRPVYKLFLDDERDPSLVDSPEWRDIMNLGPRPDAHVELLSRIDGDWVVCRTFHEAERALAELGFPLFVSFDNDLAEAREGRHFAQLLIDHDLDNRSMPEDFAWEAHTANRVSRDFINGLLNRYLDFKRSSEAPFKP